MDISKDIAQKILSLCLVFFAALPLSAQAGINCTVEIISNTKLKVIYKFEKRIDENNTFVFNTKVPNYYSNQNKFVEITNFVTYTGNQKDTLLYKDSLNLPLGSNKLSYTVSVKPNKNQLLIVQTVVKTNNFSLINFSNFLGNFEAFYQDTLSLTVLDKQKKALFKAKKPYQEILASPICLNCIQTEINTDKTNFNLYLNNKSLADSSQITAYLKETIEALNNLGTSFSLKNKEIIIIIDSLNFKAGAIAHLNTIVFHLETLDKFLFQKTLIHEYIHWLAPDLETWLNESVAEYLALKLMLKGNLISDEIFLDALSKKMKEAYLYSDYSIINLFRNETKLSLTENYSALYSKGALGAFILDLILQENTKNALSLENYVLKADALLNIENREALIEKLIDFESKYIENNESIRYNRYLNKLGVLFERNKLVAIKPKQNIELDKVDNRFIIIDNANIIGLQNGDFILKLDGKKRLTQIRDKLFSMSEKSSCFVVQRDFERIKVKVSNKETVFLKKQFQLGFIENASESQQNLWKKFKE